MAAGLRGGWGHVRGVAERGDQRRRGGAELVDLLRDRVLARLNPDSATPWHGRMRATLCNRVIQA